MKVNCYKVSIDCQENDPVDIKCGGPEYLGYDFFIDCESAKEIIDYIKETCNELNVPILDLYLDQEKFYEKDEDKVWTKEKIYKCIESNDAGLNFNSICL